MSRNLLRSVGGDDEDEDERLAGIMEDRSEETASRAFDTRMFTQDALSGRELLVPGLDHDLTRLVEVSVFRGVGE